MSMKKISLITAIAVLVCLTLGSCGNRRILGGNTGTPTNLRTDLLEFTDVNYGEGRYAIIESRQPQFSWVVPSIGDGTVQVAYRIILNKLNPLEANTEAFGISETQVWNSGWVESDASVAVPYGGPILEPGKDYEWSVELQLTNAAGKRVKTSKSVYKRFKTAGDMAEYATPYYPLEAKIEAPPSARCCGHRG